MNTKFYSKESNYRLAIKSISPFFEVYNPLNKDRIMFIEFDENGEYISEHPQISQWLRADGSFYGVYEEGKDPLQIDAITREELEVENNRELFRMDVEPNQKKRKRTNDGTL
ncbi:MAG: hypothetical protein RR448_04955 [Niameybacter sp.]